ncbi:MAG: acyl-CoA dehydrogenase family protein [Anaerolineae bacterium]|nr:acyl-CoA dehydrogenase family protein [Anaerolineae bacterium]
MDFSLTAEQEMLRKTFQEFAAREVAKVADQADREEALPPQLLQCAARQGFLGVTVPKEPYGGAGYDFMTLTLLLEALAAECASTALTLHVHNTLALGTILRHSTPALREWLVSAMAAGERIGAFALTEAGAGSDPTHLRTIATRAGDGYVLNGAKTWVSNAGMAGVFVVFAATDPAAGARGISAFVVPRETPGLVVGGRERTLGMRGVSIHRIYLQDCRVGADQRLGAEGAGYKIALETLDYGRVGLAAIAVGLARRAVELGVKFASERIQFGGPIGHKQAIQGYLADCATEVAAAEGLVRRAAWLADQGRPFTQEAAMAKLFAGRMAGNVTNRIVQVHGGYGYMMDYSIQRYYRDARGLEIAEGTTQIQQIVIAAGLFAGTAVKVRP